MPERGLSSSPVTLLAIPDAADFEPVPASRMDRMQGHFDADRELFVGRVGIAIEEVRVGYCRLSLPFSDAITQAAGAVHGGAIATLIDMAAVPAVASNFDEMTALPTIDLHIQYLGDAAGTDLAAVGWTTRVGRSLAFARSVVTRADGRPIASGQLTFKVG